MLRKLMAKKTIWLEIFVITTVIAANLTFGLPRLTNFLAVDEHLWTFDRVPQFWKAVKDANFKKTKINDKPGITVALISGPGVLSEKPIEYYSSIQNPKTKSELDSLRKMRYHFRLPIYLFSLLILPLFYFLLRKLFNPWIAMASTALIYLSPIILGISLFVNPDSLLWIFAPLSILSFLVYQKESSRKRYLYLSGLLLGLALLTKYTANVLYIFFLLLIFCDYIFIKSADDLGKYMKKSLVAYLKLMVISLATVTVFFPAIWVKSKLLLETTFLSRPFEPIWPFYASLLAAIFIDTFLLKSRVLSLFIKPLTRHSSTIAKVFCFSFLLILIAVFANTYLDMKIFDFEMILDSPKSGDHSNFNLGFFLGDFLSGFYTLFFSLTPPALLLLAISSLYVLFEKKTLSRESATGLFILLFIFIYYAGSAKSFVSPTVRYQIAIYPLASIISGIGAYQLAVFLKKKGLFQKNISYYLLAISATALLIIPLLLVKPFFFAYSSDLLPKKYVANSEVMGDGDFEVAQFMNQLPNAQNLRIWTDTVQICEEFVGTCKKGVQADILSEKFDYYVVFSVGKDKTLRFAQGRGVDPEMIKRLENFYSPKEHCDYKLMIGKREKYFAKVIKNADQ